MRTTLPLLGQRQRLTGPSVTFDVLPVAGDDFLTDGRLFCAVDGLGALVGAATIASAAVVLALFAALAVCAAADVATAVLLAVLAALDEPPIDGVAADVVFAVFAGVGFVVFATCFSGAVFKSCPGKIVYGLGM